MQATHLIKIDKLSVTSVLETGAHLIQPFEIGLVPVWPTLYGQERQVLASVFTYPGKQS